VERVVRVGVGVMILKDNKVLLGKRHEDPEKADSELHGEGKWTLPGGKIDFEEKIEDCARREVLEETGLKINKIKLVSVTNDIAYDNHFVTIGFLCEDFFGNEKVMEPEEITKWKWFSLNELPKPIFLPSLKLINNYLENKIYKGD
jgi:8-oxo-dGTP diphosphatase